MNHLIVFYDGACVICSHEIAHYQDQTGGTNIQWIDISQSNFHPAHFNLELEDLQQQLHAIRGNKIFTGVDTFIEIWRELPRYNWLSTIARQDTVKSILKLGYLGFSKIRPYLPKYTPPENQCPDGHCSSKAGLR